MNRTSKHQTPTLGRPVSFAMTAQSPLARFFTKKEPVSSPPQTPAQREENKGPESALLLRSRKLKTHRTTQKNNKRDSTEVSWGGIDIGVKALVVLHFVSEANCLQTSNLLFENRSSSEVFFNLDQIISTKTGTFLILPVDEHRCGNPTICRSFF